MDKEEDLMPVAGERASPSAKSNRRRLRMRYVAWSCLVSLVVAGYLGYLCYHFPEGSGPAGPAVARESFQSPWTQRQVLLLGIGDSVTAGFGATKGHSYFDRLTKNPPDEFEDMQGRCLAAVIPNLSARNLAMSGSNSIQHLKYQVERLETQPASVFGVVVMTSGGNDIIHPYGREPASEGAMYGASLEQARPWIANFGQRLETMLAEIEKKFPGGCEVFLADIYDPTDGKGVPWIAPYPAWNDEPKILQQYNEAICKVCSQHANVHRVPMHDAFLGHGLCCSRFWESCYHRDDPNVWYCYNIEDPTERGYDAIRRLFLLEMAKALPGHIGNAL